MMRTLVAYATAWSTRQEVRPEDLAPTPLLASYDERCRDAHGGDAAKCARLRAEYQHTVVHLFGSVENMLGFCVPPVHVAVTRFDTDAATLTFVVSEIDPDAGSVQDYQRACCVAMRSAWQSASSVVAVIDCSGVTSALVRRIFAVSDQQDVVHGVRLWATLPCKYSHIVVVRPREMVLTRPLVALGARMLSPKLRARLRVCSPADAVPTIAALRAGSRGA